MKKLIIPLLLFLVACAPPQGSAYYQNVPPTPITSITNGVKEIFEVCKRCNGDNVDVFGFRDGNYNSICYVASGGTGVSITCR